MRVKVGKKEYLQNQKGGNKRRRSGGRGELKKLREGRDGTKSTSIHSVSIHGAPAPQALGRQGRTKQARLIFLKPIVRMRTTDKKL